MSDLTNIIWQIITIEQSNGKVIVQKSGLVSQITNRKNKMHDWTAFFRTANHKRSTEVNGVIFLSVPDVKRPNDQSTVLKLNHALRFIVLGLCFYSWLSSIDLWGFVVLTVVKCRSLGALFLLIGRQASIFGGFALLTFVEHRSLGLCFTHSCQASISGSFVFTHGCQAAIFGALFYSRLSSIELWGFVLLRIVKHRSLGLYSRLSSIDLWRLCFYSRLSSIDLWGLVLLTVV